MSDKEITPVPADKLIAASMALRPYGFDISATTGNLCKHGKAVNTTVRPCKAVGCYIAVHHNQTGEILWEGFPQHLGSFVRDYYGAKLVESP